MKVLFALVEKNASNYLTCGSVRPARGPHACACRTDASERQCRSHKMVVNLLKDGEIEVRLVPLRSKAGEREMLREYSYCTVCSLPDQFHKPCQIEKAKTDYM